MHKNGLQITSEQRALIKDSLERFRIWFDDRIVRVIQTETELEDRSVIRSPAETAYDDPTTIRR